MVLLFYVVHVMMRDDGCVANEGNLGRLSRLKLVEGRNVVSARFPSKWSLATLYVYGYIQSDFPHSAECQKLFNA